MPRLSLAAVAAVAFIAAVVIPRAAVPLIDGDVWWHLRAGEEVLATGRVPSVDTWTIAGNGMRWLSQDWLTNAAMAFVLDVGGEYGPTLLSLLFAVMVGVAFWFLWMALDRRRPRPGWLARLAWFTLGLIVAGPIAGVRVQTVDLVMTALTIWVLWSYLADRRLRWLVALPLISLAWVNLHAGWPLLVALVGAVAAGEGLDRWLGRRDDALTWLQLRSLAVSGGIALLAVSINPNGFAMYGYPFATASIAAHRDFIFEWSRPDLTTFPGQMIFVLVLVAVLPTLLVARRTIPLGDGLVLVGLAALSLMAVRFALLAGPVCAAIAAIHLSGRVSRLPVAGGLARIGQRMERPPRGAAGAINLGLAGLIAAIGLVVAFARVDPAAQATAVTEAMPAAATDWLAADGSAARIFNVYAWGGYLGRELPDALIYIDGRSDIYGDGPIREYAQAIALETDPAPLLERARIDTVVFWPDSALAGWLDEHGWERVYEDAMAAVWQPAGTGG